MWFIYLAQSIKEEKASVTSSVSHDPSEIILICLCVCVCVCVCVCSVATRTNADNLAPFCLAH